MGYLALLTSEDEAPPARYDPEPVPDALIYQPLPGLRNIPDPSYLDNSESSLGGAFIGLVDSNELVTSDRGSWGMREAGDSNHRSAPCYIRSDDETGVGARSWYTNEDDDAVCTSNNSFSETTPVPHLDQSNGDNGLPPGHTAVKLLMKNINTIKKKIKQFEEEFETAFGYRPS